MKVYLNKSLPITAPTLVLVYNEQIVFLIYEWEVILV